MNHRNHRTLPCIVLFALATLLTSLTFAQPTTQPVTTITADNLNIGFAPYVWKATGVGQTARAEATMPGAYLNVGFENSKSIQMLIDGEANKACPPAAMPVVDYSVDNGPYKTTQLTKTADVYALPLADQLDPAKPHHLEFYFRSANLGPDRWKASTVHLRLAGVQLDAGGVLLPTTHHGKTAIAFGDSITEGVCVEGLCPYYSNLLMNNARATWFPLVCAALDCDYGQLGTGGQGMVKEGMALPPLPQTWDHYDAANSRLVEGKLVPQPDYIFCAMGTNDYLENPTKPSDITNAYITWLAAIRKAAPNSIIFAITPPLGWHSREIGAAVGARNEQGDQKVHLIDTAPLKGGFDANHPTKLAYDGVHPSLYGNALLATLITQEAQKSIGR